MPHDIAVINGKDAMAYVGDTPWHRLGTQSMGFDSVEAALKAGGLDWKVELEPMYIKRRGREINVPHNPGRRAVVRDVDEMVIATVGSKYAPFQNHEAFGVLNTAVREFGLHIETCGALGVRGDRCWMLAKMPASIEVVTGDKIDGYVLIFTGHNGWTPYLAKLTRVRVVCLNTLEMALASGNDVVKLPHIRTAQEELRVLEDTIAKLTAALKETGESFAKLADKKMTREQIHAYIDAVLGIPKGAEVEGKAARRREEVRRLAVEGKGAQEYAPGTAWTAFNAVTEFVDHSRSSTVKKPKTLRQADQSALFGPLARLKAKAFKLAMQA